MFKIYSSHSVLNPLVNNVSWFPPPTSLTSSPTMHSLRSFFFFNYIEPYFYKHIKHALSLGPCYLLFPLHKMLPQISEQSVPQISFRSLCSNVIIMQGHYSMGSPHPTPGHWKLHENKGLVYFIHGFMLPELPERPANLPNLKTCWARSVFHWYDYLAAIFIPSLGTTDVMLWVDALTNFTKQSLQDSEKVISALNAEKIQIRKVVLQTDWP